MKCSHWTIGDALHTLHCIRTVMAFAVKSDWLGNHIIPNKVATTDTSLSFSDRYLINSTEVAGNERQEAPTTDGRSETR